MKTRRARGRFTSGSTGLPEAGRGDRIPENPAGRRRGPGPPGGRRPGRRRRAPGGGGRGRAPAAGRADQDRGGAPQPPQPGGRVRRDAAPRPDVLPQADVRAGRSRRRGGPPGELQVPQLRGRGGHRDRPHLPRGAGRAGGGVHRRVHDRQRLRAARLSRHRRRLDAAGQGLGHDGAARARAGHRLGLPRPAAAHLRQRRPGPGRVHRRDALGHALPRRRHRPHHHAVPGGRAAVGNPGRLPPGPAGGCRRGRGRRARPAAQPRRGRAAARTRRPGRAADGKRGGPVHGARRRLGVPRHPPPAPVLRPSVMPAPRMCLILSENWTMTSARDLPVLVRWAREAEDAGFDSVMISEHIVLGPSAAANGVVANPREYALPGNQDPATPWPSSLVLLSAIAAVTTRIRLVAGAVIAPLRHPLLLARELGSLDLLSEGRLVVLPTVSWLAEEYAALGVPFGRRGDLLDEHLAAWAVLWRDTPASFSGEHYSFRDVYFEPKAYRPGGPVLWLGGGGMHRRMLARIVAYGDGFNPLGRPAWAELAALADAMRAAGRDPASLELVGGTRAVFDSPDSVADLGRALAAIGPQAEAGFTTFCIKPSQFTDDPADVGRLCREIIRRVDGMPP